MTKQKNVFKKEVKLDKQFIQGKSGKWYLITDGKFIHVCCKCGLEHRVELGLAWKEKFEKLPKGKVAIRFFRNK